MKLANMNIIQIHVNDVIREITDRLQTPGMQQDAEKKSPCPKPAAKNTTDFFRNKKSAAHFFQKQKKSLTFFHH